MGFARFIQGYLHNDRFVEPNEDGSLNVSSFIYNADTTVWTAEQQAGFNSLITKAFDQIQCSYTGSDMTTVVYRKGGVAVATLTCEYVSNTLTTVTRS